MGWIGGDKSASIKHMVVAFLPSAACGCSHVPPNFQAPSQPPNLALPAVTMWATAVRRVPVRRTSSPAGGSPPAGASLPLNEPDSSAFGEPMLV